MPLTPETVQNLLLKTVWIIGSPAEIQSEISALRGAGFRIRTRANEKKIVVLSPNVNIEPIQSTINSLIFKGYEIKYRDSSPN